MLLRLPVAEDPYRLDKSLNCETSIRLKVANNPCLQLQSGRPGADPNGLDHANKWQSCRSIHLHNTQSDPDLWRQFRTVHTVSIKMVASTI
jgi:hypothetical protein